MNTDQLAGFSAVNLARCLRWHPQGIESWSLSDWAVALAGEVGEVCEVVIIGTTGQMFSTTSALANEIGDVYAYADLFAQAVGLDFMRCIQQHPRASRYGTVSMAALELAAATGKLCDIVKKLNRERDGLEGNRLSETQLRAHLPEYLGWIGDTLQVLALRAALDLTTCVRGKFNAVSERMGVPERV